MFIASILALILLVIAIVLLFGLTPERITNDILAIISPKQSLIDKVKIARGKKKSRKISETLNHINEALVATGKGGQFTLICTLSLVLFICGAVLALLINNVFLVPIFAVTMALIPFIYAKSAISYYDKHIEEEIETALSIISTSYIRNNDIVSAIKENISYIKPPVNAIFKSFISETTLINSNIKKALDKLKHKIDNKIFKEWVDTLIQCQDDRTLNDTLLPVVTKLTDVRLVNNELKTMLAEPKKEYFMMVAMVVGNIPLLYALNKDWYDTLMNTLIGKLVLALCGVVILITAMLMAKYTKPIEYRR